MTMTVAKTIAEQIGNRAFFMIGAKNLVGSENSLTFKVGRNGKGVTHIKVTLDAGKDLYEMEGFKVRGTKVTRVHKIEGLFAEDLHEGISNMTNMVTSL
jgi:hypothetical protein